MQIAKVEIQDTFKITGRGLVIAVKILEGHFNKEDLITFYFKENLITRKILFLDMGTRKGNKGLESFMGIGIDCKNDEELETLRNWNPHNIIASIYTKKENES